MLVRFDAKLNGVVAAQFYAFSAGMVGAINEGS